MHADLLSRLFKNSKRMHWCIVLSCLFLLASVVAKLLVYGTDIELLLTSLLLVILLVTLDFSFFHERKEVVKACFAACVCTFIIKSFELVDNLAALISNGFIDTSAFSVCELLWALLLLVIFAGHFALQGFHDSKPVALKLECLVITLMNLIAIIEVVIYLIAFNGPFLLYGLFLAFGFLAKATALDALACIEMIEGSK